MDDFGGQADHAGGAAAPVPPAPRTLDIPASRSVTGRDERVTFHPAVTLPLGAACVTAIQRSLEGVTSVADALATVEGALSTVYLRFGIASWTFADAGGAAEPVTDEGIARLLPFSRGGMDAVSMADALYGAEVMSFLVRTMPGRSQPTPTAPSTSPTPASGPPSPTPSARSSRRRTAGKRSGAPAR